jgi:hypothetical protein
MKIRPLEAESFHKDRWTDMTKLIVIFRNFANEPKKLSEELCVMFNIWSNLAIGYERIAAPNLEVS